MDGCGAPVLALSLTGAGPRLPAAGVGRAGHARARRSPTRCGPTRSWSPAPGADDTRLMRGVPGLLAKGGAEGVVAVAVPGVGAVALKIDDGAQRARMPVLVVARCGRSASTRRCSTSWRVRRCSAAAVRWATSAPSMPSSDALPRSADQE